MSELADKLIACWIVVAFGASFFLGAVLSRGSKDDIFSIKFWMLPVIAAYRSMKRNYNTAGIIIGTVFITLLTLPFLVIGFAGWILVNVGLGLWIIFNLLFKKKEERT